MTARRKSIYQQLHPETKPGAAGNGRTKEKVAQVEQPTSASAAPRYDEAAAVASGQSPATVRRDVHRGEALGEDVLAQMPKADRKAIHIKLHGSFQGGCQPRGTRDRGLAAVVADFQSRNASNENAATP
jgi:hypothetical protein